MRCLVFYKIQLVTSLTCSLFLVCSDGVGRSATVAAIMSAIEKVKTVQTVDIFQTIKLLRVKRPSAVTTWVSVLL